MRIFKTVRESQHETSELMMPQHANNMGHVFGGVILSMMDKCGAIAAFRHSRASVTTASIARVDFREPIHLGDLVVMKASVNFVGRSSMEVGVRVEAEDLMTGRPPPHELVLSDVRCHRPKRSSHRGCWA